MRIRDLRKNEKGATLVEMIVSFALIGIFLAATFTAVSSALVTYYHERELMAAYTVADTVISSVKDDIHTMRPQRAASTDNTYESLDGYVKIRNGSTSTSVGSTVTALSDGNSDGSNEYYGDTIEFLRAASYNITNDEATDKDISFAETINTSGFSGTLYKNTDVISVDSSGNNGAVSRDSGYLTLRYYSRYSGTDATYNNLGADLLLTDSGLTSDPISRGLTEKLGADYYHGLYVDLHFFIPESALETDTLSVGNVANFVRFVGVTVDVYREYNGTTFSDQLYSKTEYIDIQNDVWFANYKTLYSDLSDSTLSEIPVQKDLTTTQTISGSVIWDDSSNAKGYRPSNITVTLTASNGSTYSETLLASEFSSTENSWDYAFTVPVYDSDGTTLTYTISGEDISGSYYTSSVSGYNITYTYDPNTTIIFVLNAGDGVSSGATFDFVLTNSTDSTSSITDTYTVGESKNITLKRDDEISFSLAGDSSISDYYEVTYDTSFPYTVAANGVITATIKRKTATLTVVTVAGDSFSENRTPDISIKAEVQDIGSTDSTTYNEAVSLSAVNTENTIITSTNYIGATYGVTLDTTGADVSNYDVSISSTSGTLTADTKVTVTLTRKTATVNIKAIAGNDFAAGKQLSDAITFTVTDGSINTSPSSSAYSTTLGTTSDYITVLSGNEQPIGASYTISVNSTIAANYDIVITRPDGNSITGASTSGEIISGENNIIVKFTRKSGIINLSIINSVTAGNITDVTSGNIGYTISDTETDGTSYSVSDKDFTTTNVASKSEDIYVPTGTYTITQTLPTITSHAVTTTYKLNEEAVENLSENVVVTEDDKEKAVISNSYSDAKTNLKIEFKLANSNAINTSLLRGVNISYEDSEGNTVTERVYGKTATNGVYTVIATEIPLGTVSFELSLNSNLAKIIQWDTSDTYYTVNGGAATYSTIGTETATSAGLEIIFTGDLEFKTPQSGYWGDYLYIGNYQIGVNWANSPTKDNNKENNLIYYSKNNYDNGNLYYWYYRTWNSMDYVTLEGVSYGGYNNGPYYTYALENLIYVDESETTINVTDSAGKGQIWYYKGDYYVQTRSNGNLSNRTIQDIFESNNYFYPYVKKLALWQSN